MGSSDHNQINFNIKVKTGNTYKKQWRRNFNKGKDGEISNWKSVLSGEPLLGPILFLISINDLEDDISSKVLKFADDTRIFRKITNYRPVSLTSVICKLLERLIKDHMVDFLVKHKLLNSSQHGFLKARSCLTNMLCFWKKSLSG